MIFRLKFGGEMKVLEGDFVMILSTIKECKGKSYDAGFKLWGVPDIPENRVILSKLFNTSLVGSCDYDFLFPFQKQGVKELLQGKPLLCDEVGLGKSRMAIAYCIMKEASRVLIVVPSALKKQWVEEVQKFSKLPTLIYEGSKVQRQKALSEFGDGWVVVGYEMMRQDSLVFRQRYFDIILFDEIHKLKNASTKVFKSAKRLQAGKMIGITATPFVNNPTELFNIVNFVVPGYFSFRDFYFDYVVFEDVWTGSRIVQVPVAYKNLDKLNTVLQNVMVRRKKQDVMQELPARLYKEYFVEETSAQREMRQVIMKHKKEYSPLAVITALRILCDGADLFTDSNCETKELVPCPSNIIDNSKLDALQNLVEGISGKIVIFTQYLKMASRIHEKFKNSSLLVSGETSNKEDVISQFKTSDSAKILIATDCLTFGINLQFASTVINFDLPWSPAILEQRIGRCDRIGQKNNVLVINLIMNGTVDEYVFSLLKKKLRMFNLAIDGEQPTVENVNILEEVKKKIFEQ